MHQKYVTSDVENMPKYEFDWFCLDKLQFESLPRLIIKRLIRQFDHGIHMLTGGVSVMRAGVRVSTLITILPAANVS